MLNEIYIAQIGNPLIESYLRLRLGGESQKITVSSKSKYQENSFGDGSSRIFGQADSFVSDYTFECVQFFDDSQDLNYFKSILQPGVVKEIFAYSINGTQIKTYYNLGEITKIDQEISGRMQEKSLAFGMRLLEPFWVENDNIELVDLQSVSAWVLGVGSLGTTTILNNELLDGAIGIQSQTIEQIRPFLYAQNDRYVFVQREQLFKNTLRIFRNNYLADSPDLTTANWLKTGTFTVTRDTTNLNRLDKLNQHFSVPFPATANSQLRQDCIWTKYGSNVYAEQTIWVKGTASQQIIATMEARDSTLAILYHTTSQTVTFTGNWQKITQKLNVTNSGVGYIRWFLTNSSFGAVAFQAEEPQLSLSYSSDIAIINDYTPVLASRGVYYPELNGGIYYFLNNNNLQIITTQPLDLGTGAKSSLIIVIKGSLTTNNTLSIYNEYSGLKITWLGATDTKLKFYNSDTKRLYYAETGCLVPISFYKVDIINQKMLEINTKINSVNNPYINSFEFMNIQKNTSSNLEITIKNIKQYN